MSPGRRKGREAEPQPLRLRHSVKKKGVLMETSIASLVSMVTLTAAMLLGLCGDASALGVVNDPVCGSLERFNQSHRWQDLPGCTERRDYSNPRSAVTLLGRAKDAFK